MQVSAASSNLPLSTQVIKRAGEAAQAPGSPVTPEQVNKAVDAASDRVQQAQDNRAAEHGLRVLAKPFTSQTLAEALLDALNTPKSDASGAQ